ncbi:DUF2635 domain-containing protein [Providencia rettgeri]|uniref:DUF2635 domain-containing protein n=1 Tax=Providencia rettgeri TaxID=587 RepID=UPI003015ED3F
MSFLYIKPVSGVTVRDPETYQPLAAEGEVKPRNAFWLRRLKDGDVVQVDESSQGDQA